jgi:hypothetical protein
MRLPILATLLLSGFTCYAQADYVKVHLLVNAVKDWQAPIQNALAAKLNAIPDAQIITDEKCEDCVFQVYVDVNQLLSQASKLFGYDMMILVLGTYDNKLLTLLIEEGEKGAATPEVRKLLRFEKYLISGNMFLAGMEHFYGPTDEISQGYDKAVSLLKSKAIPRYREFQKQFADVLAGFASPEKSAQQSSAEKAKSKI